MAWTALERMLLTERERPRGGLSRPLMVETSVPPHQGPYLVSNMTGKFLRVAGDHPTLRYAFSECTLEEEDSLLLSLYETVVHYGYTAPTLEAATAQLTQLSSVVINSADLGRLGVDVPEAERVMGLEGVVTVVGGVRVLLGGVPEGSVLAAGIPARAGVYCRVGDSVGVWVRPGRSLVAVPVCGSKLFSNTQPPTSGTSPVRPSTAGGSPMNRSSSTGSDTSTPTGKSRIYQWRPRRS